MVSFQNDLFTMPISFSLDFAKGVLEDARRKLARVQDQFPPGHALCSKAFNLLNQLQDLKHEAFYFQYNPTDRYIPEFEEEGSASWDERLFLFLAQADALFEDVCQGLDEREEARKKAWREKKLRERKLREKKMQ